MLEPRRGSHGGRTGQGRASGRIAASAGPAGAAVETAEAIDADLEFHRILARAGGNRILELVLESLGELGRASRQATIATTGIALATSITN